MFWAKRNKAGKLCECLYQPTNQKAGHLHYEGFENFTRSHQVNISTEKILLQIILKIYLGTLFLQLIRIL